MPHPVREPAEWMVRSDDRILELLALGDRRFKMPPNMIYGNLDLSSDWTYERLRVLTEAGLVEKVNSLYRITDKGEQYLEGELDASTLDYEPD